ncbi:hypothetical protein HN499_00050 [archaeon]|jgi:hypothetical protein|nr:hypothetical protein [archaeon]
MEASEKAANQDAVERLTRISKLVSLDELGEDIQANEDLAILLDYDALILPNDQFPKKDSTSEQEYIKFRVGEDALYLTKLLAFLGEYQKWSKEEEPTVGIAPGTLAQYMELVRSIKRDVRKCSKARHRYPADYFEALERRAALHHQIQKRLESHVVRVEEPDGFRELISNPALGIEVNPETGELTGHPATPHQIELISKALLMGSNTLIPTRSRGISYRVTNILLLTNEGSLPWAKDLEPTEDLTALIEDTSVGVLDYAPRRKGESYHLGVTFLGGY